MIENRPLCIDLNVAVTNKREKIKFMAIEGHAAALSGIVDAMDPQHTARIEKEVFIIDCCYLKNHVQLR